MDYHYDAFFSYNHNPRDMQLTGALQQKLEHYKVPKEVSTRTGKKKIERVFLDKGELEVAGDLNEEILTALRNTEYLLVVCSPESYESPWVKKEIEYFLRTHPKEKVLTILSAGEPDDVIPDVLRYREIEAEDGSVTREIAEPLSCDYRIPVKEADRTELPRLVAAIIGCRYDDLVQRKKQYRQKIIARIAAASAAAMSLLSAYMIWSNHQISINYRNTLIEQSHTLAFQSEQALSQGNRIDALQYALDALPSEEQDRPVITDAVHALEKALSLYTTPEASGESAVRQYKGVINGKSLDELYVYKIVTLRQGEKRYLLAIYDDTGYVCIWDTDTGEQQFTEFSDKLASEGVVVQNALGCDDGSTVLISNDLIICLDLSSSQERWRIEPEGYESFECAVACSSGNSLWFCTADDPGCIAEADLSSGDIKHKYENEGSPCSICSSSDGRTAVCSFRVYSENNFFLSDHDTVVCFGPGKNDQKVLADLPYVTDVEFIDSTKAVATGLQNIPEIDPSMHKLAFVEFGGILKALNYAEKKDCFISCFETEKGSRIWDTAFSGVYVSYPEISRSDSYESDGKIACTIGNCLKYFDIHGKAKGEVRFGSPVMTYYSNYSNADDERLYAVLADGSRGSASVSEKNVFNAFDLFCGPVSKAVHDDRSLFVLCSEFADENAADRILEYRERAYDSKWQEYDKIDLPEGSIRYDSVVLPYKENFLILRKYRDGNYRYKSVLIDSVSGEIRGGEATVGGTDDTDYDYCGFNEEEGTAYFISEDLRHPVMAALDIETADVKKEAIRLDGLDANDTILGKKAVKSSAGIRIYILYYCSSDDSIKLLVTEPENRQSQTLSLMEQTGGIYSAPALYFDAEGNGVWLYAGNMIRKFDMNSGDELFTVETDYEPEAIVADNGSSRMMAIESRGSADVLHAYDLKTKETTAETILGNLDMSDTALEATDLGDGSLLLHTGLSAVIIDSKDCSRIIQISEFSGYNRDTNEICMHTNDKFGHVPYRNMTDAIIEARELVGDISQ